jgi:hypothetical protein
MRPFRATVDSMAFSVLWGCDRVGPTAVLDWVHVDARSVRVLRKPRASSAPVRSQTHTVSAVTPFRANL